MKHISTHLCLVLLFVVGFSPVFGDIIPEGQHPVQREVSIINLRVFPEIALIGYITGPMSQPYEAYILEENIPLDKGYKLNEFKVFAIKKTLLDSQGGLDNIDLKKVSQTTPPVDILDPVGQPVSDKNPLIAESFYYTITNVTNAAVTLKLTRQVLKYNNGQPDKTITY